MLCCSRFGSLSNMWLEVGNDDTAPPLTVTRRTGLFALEAVWDGGRKMC